MQSSCIAYALYAPVGVANLATRQPPGFHRTG